MGYFDEITVPKQSSQTGSTPKVSGNYFNSIIVSKNYVVPPVQEVQQSAESKITDTFFPSTKQVVQELGSDPLSLKANPKKALTDVWNSIKGSVVQEGQNLKDLFTPSKTETFSQKVAAPVKLITGAANIAFSPISALFAGANDIPVLGSISKLVTLPFAVAGDSGKDIGMGFIEGLPISKKAKQQLSPAIEDLFSLASQIYVGGKVAEITPKIKNTFIKKYGEKDTEILINKATEMAQQKVEHLQDSSIQNNYFDNIKVPENLKSEVFSDTLSKDNISKLSDISGNSLQNNLSGVKEKSVQYFKDNPEQITTEPIKVREVDGKLTIEDGRHRLQAAKEAGIDNLKVVDVTGNYEKNASSKILQELGINSNPEKVSVSSAQLPVGQGELKISKLEARIKDKLGKITPEEAKVQGFSTYERMNKKENIAKAAEFVSKNSPDDILAVLKGEKDAPAGLTHGAIGIAAEASAEMGGHADLIAKLASLRGTRYGQEISILSEADPLSVTHQTRQIQISRTENVQKKLPKGKTIEKAKKEFVQKNKSEIKTTRMKLADAQSLLDKLIC